MKVVIAVEEFDPAKGYLEYYLAKELATLGDDVYVLTFGLSTGPNTTTMEGFSVVNIPHSAVIHGYHVPSFRGLAYILKFIKTKRPDVIHCQPLDSLLSLLLITWKSFFNYKIAGSILTQLNLVFSKTDLKTKALLAISQIVVKSFAAKQSEAVFAKTSELSKLLSQSYCVPQRKFQIIPLGSNPEIFKPDSTARAQTRSKLRLSEGDIVLVYSGKLDATKGLDVLLQALAPLVAKEQKVKLLIIGKGKEEFEKYLKRK